MPWWDKAISAGKEATEKVAFEANKLVRVQNEERALNDLRGKAQARLADLGQIALTLYRNGTLADPTISAAAQEIAALEAQIADQQARVEAMKAEQHQGQPGAPAPETPAPAAPPPAPVSSAAAAPPAAPPPAPVSSTPAAAPTGSAPEPAPAPTAREIVICPNCGMQVRATAVFCPECGNKMKQ